ncbi:nucleotidyltransferase domain-containing protein [Candidatus Pacearchaeota archaeon]|nr:nucleotidyltransferase domain-containing protein [Candidatus Pacearchaeota archaeon]
MANQNQDIPEMNLDRKYSKKIPNAESPEKIKKNVEKTKKELEKLKSFIVKKYPFTQSLSVLPPQAIKKFIEEEEMPKETEKHMQLYMIVPEEKLKEIPKMTQEIVKQIEKLNSNKEHKIWLQIKTPIDIWDMCLDSKFDLAGAIAMSFPLYDKGFLGALRMAEIHKSLVLQKFEKYVVSYVIAGSFVGGKATPTSDLDVYVIINDTDVKRMPRVELKERLRSIIYQYVGEATALAGVKNELHIQTYLLTDFWDAVKDANPVIFTFIRDGIPIYDRGTFMPWKALLKMGKLRPSPESIDMFMKTAEKTKEMVNRRLLEAMMDIYYSVLNPSQALIMLYGLPPPTHKETITMMEDIFVKKEKMIKKSDMEILVKAVKLFKEYEHDTKFKISGKKIDEMVKETDAYLKTLKELRKQIEKGAQEKVIEQIYHDVFGLLKAGMGKKAQAVLISEFEEDFVKKGKFTAQHLRILKDLVKARTDFKKGKLNFHKVEEARKNTSILINDLIEYNQRCELAGKGK